MSAGVRTITVAHKPWSCAGCRAVILPGHTYSKWVCLPGHDLVPAWSTLRYCAGCAYLVGGGYEIPTTEAWPPAVVRPGGRIYQPRYLRAETWQNDWAERDRDWCGAVVLGTHDIEIARPLAEKAVRQVDDDLRPVNPHTVWWRLVPRGNDEWQWDYDPVRGAAGVWWSADYAATEGGDGACSTSPTPARPPCGTP